MRCESQYKQSLFYRLWWFNVQ